MEVHQRTWPTGLYVIAVLAVAIGALAVAWRSPPVAAGGPYPFRLERASTPEGPALITAVSTGLIWRPGIIPPTTVTVRNSAARRADCEIWWILARQREARPWEHPVMRSQPVRVQLAPFKSRTVGVNVLLVNSRQVGTFALSVWAHCRSSAATGWPRRTGRRWAAAWRYSARPSNWSGARKTLASTGCTNCQPSEGSGRAGPVRSAWK